MKRPLWFKSKKAYGWGWYPATWQGWFILLVWIGLVAWNAFRIDYASRSVNEVLIELVPQTLLLFVILFAICWVTGEKASWHWGKD